MQQLVDPSLAARHMPVDVYVGGVEHGELLFFDLETGMGQGRLGQFLCLRYVEFVIVTWIQFILRSFFRIIFPSSQLLSICTMLVSSPISLLISEQ